MKSHVLPLRVYLQVFAALMTLTAVTTGIAFVDLGAWNTVVALTIALVKVVVVVLWFMHVKYSPRLIWVAALASLYWLLILFGFLMSDYVTRVPVEGWAPPIAW